MRGARVHNLKNVSLDLPRDSLIVFTGLSGSGKSSLAFDTIFAEGQRRYVESLSAYARQFLGQMDKPDCDFIEGLSPAVSIDQKSTSRNPRSTVGTITEVYDYLRLLFARIGIPHCPVCSAVIGRQSPQQIVDRLMGLAEGTRFQVLAPIVRGRKGEFQETFRQLVADGYARVRVDGKLHPLTEPPVLDKKRKHDVDVVVDRVVVKASAKQRITESVEAALQLAHGVVGVEFVDLPADDPDREKRFSEKLGCPNEHDVAIDELEPRQFSFNGPWGACPECSGLGTMLEPDPELIIPDETLSLADGAIAPWNTPHLKGHFEHVLEALSLETGFDMRTPWQNLAAKHRKVLLNGVPGAVVVSFRNRFGRTRSFSQKYEGILPFVRRRYAESETDSARERWGGYMREINCHSCGGTRLRPETLCVTVAGRNIAEVADLSIGEAFEYLDALSLNEREARIAERVVKEIRERLRFLLDVGLDYLTLSRSAGSLSGGEAQRIRLATQIGSGLVGVLYVLDEPTIGLHSRDTERLVRTLDSIRELGNTVVVVEHDRETMKAADALIEMGPAAGELGGEIVHSGSYEEVLGTEGLTGPYLRGDATGIVRSGARRKPSGWLTVKGAEHHNLKGIDVKIPRGVFTCLSGVSGSGKSSFLYDILYKGMRRRLDRDFRERPGRFRALEGADAFENVVLVDQSPIGRTPRSNPATYTGVFSLIREFFAGLPEANIRGYKPGRFSFNVKGGRCEACGGAGSVKVSMLFLPDIYVDCEVCGGTRYNHETLEVRFKGKSIADVLAMTVNEAVAFFADIPRIAGKLRLIQDAGLGYIRLGQSALTLSGGEAQRVKLSKELAKRFGGRTLYLLDEPTTGLFYTDVRKLLEIVHRIVDQGSTVVFIEHNLDVLLSADHIIDLGPEGGDGGGRVVAQGTPERVAARGEGYTARFLREYMEEIESNKSKGELRHAG